MARPIIEMSQKNRDNLLQILLYKEYRDYVKNYELEKYLSKEIIKNEENKYNLITFDEWLEKILEEF